MLKSYLTASINKEGRIIHDFLLHFTALIQKAKKDQCPAPPALYLVGGYVRDLILNFCGFSVKPSDIDLVVAGFSADEIEILMRILEKCSEICPIKNIYRVENSFPVIKVHVEGLNSPIDVALARGYETSTGPGHQDFVFKTKDITIKEDLARRDFTINAMALQIISRGDSIETTIIDEFSGLADICDRRISTVGPPGRTFREDPIRQIRAIRFFARLKDFGFQIDPRTLEAIKTTFPSTFHTIPMEPLIKEAGKAFKENFPLAFALFRETGVLSHSFPFLDKIHQEDIDFLETMFSGLKGKLNVKRVWVLILFMMAREEIERIFKQEPVSLTERNYQIPATVKLSHELRLPSEITEHVGKLAQLYYYPYLPHPLSSLEGALQWLKQRPGRGWLWKVYTRLTKFETGRIPRLRSKIRLINTSVELYTKAELKGFFKGNGIEPGPIRAEMLFGARERFSTERFPARRNSSERHFRITGNMRS